MNVSSKTSAPKKSLAKKLALAFVGVSSVAIIGSAGVAAAATPQTKYLPNKEACKTEWKSLGFANTAACETYWSQQKKAQAAQSLAGSNGNGYGGSNSGGVTVVVSGNNNVVNIVVNYFFGG